MLGAGVMRHGPYSEISLASVPVENLGPRFFSTHIRGVVLMFPASFVHRSFIIRGGTSVRHIDQVEKKSFEGLISKVGSFSQELI